MSIAMSGAICDVCGTHILPILDDNCNPFSCGDFEGTLFCHDKCKHFVLEMSEKKDWKVLPEGPMRKAYEQRKQATPGDPRTFKSEDELLEQLGIEEP